MMDIKYSIFVVLVVCAMLAITKYYAEVQEAAIDGTEVAGLLNVIAEK
jgi:hypothetical protein